MNHMTKCWLWALLLLFLFGVGCKQRSVPDSGPQETKSEPPYVAGEGAVGFKIHSADSSAGKRRWLATYESGGRVARFVIELDDPGKPTNAGFTFGRGRFLAESGSDPGTLLATLSKALEAKSTPKKVPRVSNLPFTFALLGDNAPRFSDGSFGRNGAGHWMAMKIFLHDGEGEVYLNLNPVIGKAEFAIKDPDYGDIVMAELAKVL